MNGWREDLVNDNVDHISPKTREKAMTLAENAKAIGLDAGKIRYNNSEDFMSFWFTNGLTFIIVFCTPYGYMAEIHTTEEGEVKPTFSLPKNIRHFLYFIKREGLTSFDQYHEELAELANLDDADLEDIIQQFMDES